MIPERLRGGEVDDLEGSARGIRLRRKEGAEVPRHLEVGVLGILLRVQQNATGGRDRGHDVDVAVRAELVVVAGEAAGEPHDLRRADRAGQLRLDACPVCEAVAARVEAELARTIGATKVVWLPRGLTRDYDEFGTNGHVDIVATIPTPGRVLLHAQQNSEHPDFEVSRDLRAFLSEQTDAAGRTFEIIDLPAPETLRDHEGFVDYSYVNHLVVNGGIIACGFGEERADAQAREVLEAAYPGRRAVTVDARQIFAGGGGIHCITQQQPAVAR